MDSQPAIAPAPGYVLIELLSDDNVTTGGVYLPQEEQHSVVPALGKIIEIGDPKIAHDNGVAIKCPFAKEVNVHYRRGTEIKVPLLEKRAYLNWDHILGVVKK